MEYIFLSSTLQNVVRYLLCHNYANDAENETNSHHPALLSENLWGRTEESTLKQGFFRPKLEKCGEIKSKNLIKRADSILL